MNHLIQIWTSVRVHESFDLDRDFGEQIVMLYFFYFIFFKQYKTNHYGSTVIKKKQERKSIHNYKCPKKKITV